MSLGRDILAEVVHQELVVAILVAIRHRSNNQSISSPTLALILWSRDADKLVRLLEFRDSDNQLLLIPTRLVISTLDDTANTTSSSDTMDKFIFHFGCDSRIRV